MNNRKYNIPVPRKNFKHKRFIAIPDYSIMKAFKSLKLEEGLSNNKKVRQPLINSWRLQPLLTVLSP